MLRRVALSLAVLLVLALAPVAMATPVASTDCTDVAAVPKAGCFVLATESDAGAIAACEARAGGASASSGAGACFAAAPDGSSAALGGNGARERNGTATYAMYGVMKAARVAACGGNASGGSGGGGADGSTSQWARVGCRAPGAGGVRVVTNDLANADGDGSAHADAGDAASSDLAVNHTKHLGNVKYEDRAAGQTVSCGVDLDAAPAPAAGC